VSAEAVLEAARRRSAALAARDAGALRALHHPDLRWTTHRDEVLDRERYVAGNTAGDLVWRAQRLEDAQVTLAGDTAVLTAIAVDDVERDGTPQTFRLRVTLTWVREDGEWRCLAGHAG
jgi:ketosteroid isomerase-like protein